MSSFNNRLFAPLFLLSISSLSQQGFAELVTQSDRTINHKAALEKYRHDAYDARYPEINYAQLKKALDAKQVFLIDANREETFNKGHLPGAKSLANLEKLEPQLPYLKSYPIVVYCGGPQCTAWYWAADFATAKGYTNIMHYKQGTKGWKAAGATFETSAIN